MYNSLGEPFSKRKFERSFDNIIVNRKSQSFQQLRSEKDLNRMSFQRIIQIRMIYFNAVHILAVFMNNANILYRHKKSKLRSSDYVCNFAINSI